SSQTIVRAIDGAVADLINRADVSANTGDDHTGGGVLLLSAGAGSLYTPGYFQIILGPAAATNAGAGWRLLELTNVTYFNDNSATYGLPPATYTLTFLSIPGFLAPTNRPLSITAKQTSVIFANYTNLIAKAAV